VTARRLLYLNTHRLSAFSWRQGKLLPEGVFENGDEGLIQFAAYLGKNRRSHFSLLANVAEEGHVLETIPFLQGNDRQALITRKIGQHFLGTPLATAFSLGYEKNQRKNEKVLISALTNPGHFEPWLQRINLAEVPLAGVYTVAQLGGLLLKKLDQTNNRCLLLSMQDHSIRESYLVNGQTLFSRMAPIVDSSIAGIASSFAAEAGKLHQYLIGQRLVGREENLPVFIIAYPPAISAIEKACPDRGHLSFSIIDSHLASQKLGLHTPPEDNRCDVLFLHLLATAAPGQQFAGETHRHDFRLSQIRQGIIAAGLIALLGSLLFSAREIYNAYSLRDETQGLKIAEADLSWRYQEISATFPQLGIDNETLRRLASRHASLTLQQRQPVQAYRLVSRALNEMPGITLEGLDWKIGSAGTASPAGIEGNDEITTIRGAIRPLPNATTRQILATFEQFVELLKSNPEYTINILQQPFDMESGRALRGGDSEDENAKPRPFTVEINRKISP
jgi:hypothetical protein